jgi:hypothetical protein
MMITVVREGPRYTDSSAFLECSEYLGGRLSGLLQAMGVELSRGDGVVLIALALAKARRFLRFVETRRRSGKHRSLPPRARRLEGAASGRR